MNKFALAAILALVGASGAFAKTYKGDYTVSFFIDPGANPGSQICLDLTSTKNVAGFTTSGTFVDTEGLSITGQYLLDGKSFHLVILGSAYEDNVDAIGKASGSSVAGAFDDFDSAYSPVVTSNETTAHDIVAGTFTLTPGCAPAAQRNHSTHRTTTY
jgi:hypothetical protein